MAGVPGAAPRRRTTGENDNGKELNQRVTVAQTDAPHAVGYAAATRGGGRESSGREKPGKRDGLRKAAGVGGPRYYHPARGGREDTLA